MAKTLTSDCHSCEFVKVGKDNQFLCWWGKSKNKKKLIEGKKRGNCKLKRTGGQ